MKRKLLFLFLFSILLFIIITESSANSNTPFQSIRLFISPGFAYHFPLTTDYDSLEGVFNADIPINVHLDLRYSDWVSLLTGIELIYNVNYQKILLDEERFAFYLHSIFIRLPIMVKVYPFVKRHEAYYNFFFAFGGVLHFWPMNLYVVYTETNLIHTGNLYRPYHSEMPPGNIYTPVNIGFKFAIGNHFYITNKFLMGVEFFTTYLFIPHVNGYYFGMNYNRGNNVIMEFDLSVGLSFSFGLFIYE